MTRAALVALGLLVSAPALGHDEALTNAAPSVRDDWIGLGSRIHGGFGSLIALGIRIGFDASLRTGGRIREFDVTYFEGAGSPCPCVVDGLIAALAASPGQRTLRVSPEAAPEGAFGRVVIRHRPTGRVLEYLIPASAFPGLVAVNREPPEARWDYVMRQPPDALYAVTVLEEGHPPAASAPPPPSAPAGAPR